MVELNQRENIDESFLLHNGSANRFKIRRVSCGDQPSRTSTDHQLMPQTPNGLIYTRANFNNGDKN